MTNHQLHPLTLRDLDKKNRFIKILTFIHDRTNDHLNQKRNQPTLTILLLSRGFANLYNLKKENWRDKKIYNNILLIWLSRQTELINHPRFEPLGTKVIRKMRQKGLFPMIYQNTQALEQRSTKVLRTLNYLNDYLFMLICFSASSMLWRLASNVS